jgi:hypothetical protein
MKNFAQIAGRKIRVKKSPLKVLSLKFLMALFLLMQSFGKPSFRF